MEVSLVSLLRCNLIVGEMWRIPPPQMMRLWLDVKYGGYQTPHPRMISSWQLKWHVQCGGGPIHPPSVISSWELKWHAILEDLPNPSPSNLNLNLLIYYSPILTRSFSSALHWLLVLANLLSLTSFWGGATSSHLNSLGSIQGCCLMQHTHLVKPLAIITCLS